MLIKFQCLQWPSETSQWHTPQWNFTAHISHDIQLIIKFSKWQSLCRDRYELIILMSLAILVLYMMTSWNETFSALLAICVENSPVTGEFPAQRPATRSFDVFFDLHLDKRLSKQGWWFETPSCPLWRHCKVIMITWLLMSEKGGKTLIIHPLIFIDYVTLLKMANGISQNLKELAGTRSSPVTMISHGWYHTAYISHETN